MGRFFLISISANKDLINGQRDFHVCCYLLYHQVDAGQWLSAGQNNAARPGRWPLVCGTHRILGQLTDFSWDIANADSGISKATPSNIESVSDGHSKDRDIGIEM